MHWQDASGPTHFSSNCLSLSSMFVRIFRLFYISWKTNPKCNFQCAGSRVRAHNAELWLSFVWINSFRWCRKSLTQLTASASEACVSRCHAKNATLDATNRPNAPAKIYDAQMPRLAYVHFSLLHRAFSVFFRHNFSPTCNSTIISLRAVFIRFVINYKVLACAFLVQNHFVHSWNITRNSHTLIYNEFRWTLLRRRASPAKISE